MVISAKEFLKLSDDEMVRSSGMSTCTVCGCRLQETITGNRWTADGYVCSDCYFAEMGKELEKHPISVPRTHRGS